MSENLKNKSVQFSRLCSGHGRTYDIKSTIKRLEKENMSLDAQLAESNRQNEHLKDQLKQAVAIIEAGKARGE
jgi:predicted RNase H-like nuclease (RuvC/YqgF family)